MEKFLKKLEKMVQEGVDNLNKVEIPRTDAKIEDAEQKLRSLREEHTGLVKGLSKLTKVLAAIQE